MTTAISNSSDSKKDHQASPCTDRSSMSYITLKNILSGHSPRPYTLNAFLNFLTQHHSIENLDFITDTESYCEFYNISVASLDKSNTMQGISPVVKQWTRLMITYICPGSPSEINLPSSIRDPLLGFFYDTTFAPSPGRLQPALNHAHEILTESALVPFIKSFHSAYNHDRAGGYVPKSTLCDANFGTVPSRTAYSREENVPGPIENNFREQVEPNQHLTVKVRSFVHLKRRKSKGWFSCLQRRSP